MNSQPTPTRRRFYPPRISLRELLRQLNAAPRWLAVVMIGMLLVCMCFTRLVFYQDIAEDTTAEEANRRFSKAWSFVRVPDKATHINLYARYIGGGADFDIGEEDFKSWCQERGWTLTEDRNIPPSPPLYVKVGPDNVRHCYQFSNATHRGGWSVMYDIDRKRAWVHLSAR